MRGVGLVALIVGAFVVAIAGLILAVWILVWNLTDIQNVGFNFWNVFWIALASAALLGGVTAKVRN